MGRGALPGVAASEPLLGCVGFSEPPVSLHSRTGRGSETCAHQVSTEATRGSLLNNRVRSQGRKGHREAWRPLLGHTVGGTVRVGGRESSKYASRRGKVEKRGRGRGGTERGPERVDPPRPRVWVAPGPDLPGQ